MKYRHWLLGLSLSLIVGVLAFAATRASLTAPAVPTPALPQEALLDWLGVSAAQRGQLAIDGQFPQDIADLAAALASARDALAAAWETPDAPREQIEAQVEAVIQAGAALERRLADYLLSLRAQLPPEQERKLAALCAECLREAPGGRWRRGGGGGGQGMGRGYGPAMGRGPWGQGAQEP
jgi:Spy/CpxP family protein refolding chaperone